MPLSEDEQRILHEIEQQFYETDPDLARTVGSTSLYRHYFRSLKWATLLFVSGIVLLVYSLVAFGYVVAFVGFLVMLGAALWAERCVRKLGRAGFQQVTSSVKAAGLRDALGKSTERFREKFKREGQ
ncbi:MAG: DUF3040 domain-containing protein [Acidimicrobiia bacterium]